jgi:AraC family transcriptional regulator, transcriptional activator FtrA
VTPFTFRTEHTLILLATLAVKDGAKDNLRYHHAMAKQKRLVVAVAYDGLCTFEFGCVVEVFALTRPELQVDWYEFGVCAAERGRIRAAGGVTLRVPRGLSLLDAADTILIPGWRDPDEEPPVALVRKIRAAYERGARLASICSGVFVLAAAGVLGGKKATTHWRYAERLASRYPTIQVRPNDLYTVQGQVITAAGSAAGLDMMLHIVRSDHGVKVANIVARRLVIPPYRRGDQAQFVMRPILPDESGRLTLLIDWIRGNLRRPHTLNSLATRAAMSPRTLQRQFVDATGFSAYEWILRERVAVAQEMLESRNAALARVADLCGFKSEQSMRKHFRRIAGTSPAAYRQQFHG